LERQGDLLVKGQTLDPAEQAILDDIARQLERDKPRVSERRCPGCRRAFELLDVGGIEIDSCRICRGIWFDPGELTSMAGLKSETPAPGKVTRASRYRCPDCRSKMTEYALFHPLNLLVDRCPEGHGVYLEDRELERVFEVGR